jgi:hypothetical protein
MLRSETVEQIAREKTCPELEPFHPLRLSLSPLLLTLVVLLISFAVVNLGLRAVAQYAVPAPNPFLPYADVFPGQPARAVEVRGFSCFNDASHYNHDPIEQRCILSPAIGIFSGVEAIISAGIIRQITFNLRDKTLQGGDLEIFLEMPTLHVFNHVAHFILPRRFIIANNGYPKRFSPYLPVWSISFTAIIVEGESNNLTQ